MQSAPGTVVLLLHAHLPYVRHPEHECFLEENWFYEAAVETYLPLIDMLSRLIEDNVDYRITISLSPTLLEMFSNELLNRRLKRHIETLIELTNKEVRRNRRDKRLLPLSKMYNERLLLAKRVYEKRGLIEGFRGLMESGKVELITTAATHAYLPNLSPFPEAVMTQIDVGMAAFKRHFPRGPVGDFSRRPVGLWLPECGYFDGLDVFLKEASVGYFFLEGHGILNGTPKARHGIYRPIKTPSGPVAFGRDAEAAKLIWCAKTGYPCDPVYREFHSDIGFDLPVDYVGPYFNPGGVRTPTGIKYRRITGSEKKDLYIRDAALNKAKEHALDFAARLNRRAEELGSYGFAPVITLPFDAELFGHWWFEGIEWLECLLRGLHARGDGIKTTTPTEFMAENPALDELTPSFSSWGYGGYSRTWLNSENDGFLMETHRACRRMDEILEKTRFGEKGMMSPLARRGPCPLIRRAVKQAQTQLLLAQSSDWPFLISSGTAPHYAEMRLRGHLESFNRLYEMVMEGRIFEGYLAGLELKDNVFC